MVGLLFEENIKGNEKLWKREFQIFSTLLHTLQLLKRRIVEKGETAGNQHFFFLFPTFPKQIAFFQSHVFCGLLLV